MKRRAWLAGGVAVAAAATGAGWGWWQRQQAADPFEPAFWNQPFDTLDGPALTLGSLRGSPLLINFWATWCPPCVKELPEIERFYQAQRGRGWQVLGLALDRAEAVRGFLQHTPVSFGVALAGLRGTDLLRQLGNPSGALPFTVLLDAEGRISQRKLGETHFEELQSWAASLA